MLSWGFVVGEWLIPTAPGMLAAEDIAPLFVQAGFLLEQKRFEDAITLYDRILEQLPQYADAYNSRGLARRLLGHVEAAKADYHQAIAANANFALPYINLGVLLMREHRISEANALFRQAAQVSPWLPTPHNNLGIALRHAGKLDEAVAEYRQAIALNDRDPVPYYNLGLALLLNGQVDEAATALRRAVALQPDPMPRVLFHLGVALFEQGRDREALQVFERCQALRPQRTALDAAHFAAYDFGAVVSTTLADEHEFIQMARRYASAVREKIRTSP
jgi:Flp pilus assembly protein TadD